MIDHERLARRALAGDRSAALRLADHLRASGGLIGRFGGVFDTPIGEAEVIVAAVGDPDDPPGPGGSPLEHGIRVRVANDLGRGHGIAWDVRLSPGREFDVPWVEVRLDHDTDWFGRDDSRFARYVALFDHEVRPSLKRWLAGRGGVEEFRRHLRLDVIRRAELEREKAQEQCEKAESKVADAVIDWLRAGGRP